MAPFILLLLAVVPLFYGLFIQIQQVSIHHKMKERLEARFLQTIAVAKDAIHWVKDGKEILVNGRMFDIRSFDYQKGVYTFSGLYDNDETVLMVQLQKDQQANSSNSKQLVQLFHLLQTLYSNSTADQVTIMSALSPEFPVLYPLLPSQYISIFTPPPET